MRQSPLSQLNNFARLKYLQHSPEGRDRKSGESALTGEGLVGASDFCRNLLSDMEKISTQILTTNVEDVVIVRAEKVITPERILQKVKQNEAL